MTPRERALALLDTDPADGLRATAALIREVARAATEGPWQSAPKTADAVIAPDREYETDAQRRNFENWYGGFPVAESMSAADREHVLGWQPQVALAVADWLDEIGSWPRTYVNVTHPVAVARVWLTRPLTPPGAP